MAKRGAPVLSFLAEDDAAYDFPDPSFEVQDAGRQLMLRAFLFRDGMLYKDGSAITKTVTAEDLDLENRQRVGRGISATVYHVIYKPTGQPLALKCIPINTKVHRDEISAELSVLTSGIEHPHVVKHFGAFWDAESHTIGIAMEWMAYSLQDIAKLPIAESEEILQAIAFQLVSAIAFLHDDCHLIHRDIKPSNILVNAQGEIKLADFGIAKCIKTLLMSNSFVGTEIFMAPERLEQSEYSFTSDIWSVGLTLIACANKGVAWSSDKINVFAIVGRAQAGDVPRLPTEGSCRFSDKAQDFVAQCLQYDSSKRPSAAKLLQHPWLAGLTQKGCVETMQRTVALVTALSRDAKRSNEARGFSQTAEVSRHLEGLDAVIGGDGEAQ